MKKLLSALALTSLMMAGPANALTNKGDTYQSDSVSVSICVGVIVQVCVEVELD